MSNRNFGYYGNNRLQKQTYARNIYSNINGRQISNPQNSNGNASQMETYRSGSQTEYSRGLIGAGETISIGGTVVPNNIPPAICIPTTIDISSIATYDGYQYILNDNTTIQECSILNILTRFLIPSGVTLINNGTINNNRAIFKNEGIIINNGIINGINGGCIDNYNIYTNNGIMYINEWTYLNNRHGTFNNNNIIYVYTTPPYSISEIRNFDIFINNGIIYTGTISCGIGIINVIIPGSIPITGSGIITDGCP